MKPIHWLAAIPFVGLPIGPVVHDELRPFILGMPFPLGWITVWLVLTAVVMAVVYALDPANRPGHQPGDQPGNGEDRP